MTQQTERDEALIAEARRCAAIDRNRSHDDPRIHTSFETHLIRLARENWTPPAKPDRYVEVWKEAYAAYTSQSLTKDGPDRAAAAVLRRHFEPPNEVVEAAKTIVKNNVAITQNSRIIADHILKGDQ